MEIEKNISLAKLSSFRVGGLAQFFIRVQKKAELLEALNFAKEKKLPVFCLGMGSNIIFSDQGFDGLVIKLENKNMVIKNDEIVAGAGALNAQVFIKAKEAGLDFSQLAGIPGTIGGSVAGNAGAHGAEIKDFFLSAEIFDLENNKFFNKKITFFNFAYRHSILREINQWLIWQLRLKLPKATKSDIVAKNKHYWEKREKTQEKIFTAGSFFRNPSEGAAGYYLEQAGMKGYQIGQAAFSSKHANFLINLGQATQTDVIKLAKLAKKKVAAKFNIELQNEVKIIDEKGKEIKV